MVKKKKEKQNVMDVGFFIFPSGPLLSHPIHVFVCMSVCVCEWGWILMRALVCCQLAECRPWSQCCSMTCTNMEMTKIPFITKSLSVYPSLCSLCLCPCLSVWMFPSPFVFILCAFSYLLSKCLWIPLSPFPVFSISCLLTYISICIQSSLLFSQICYSIFHFCHLTVSPLPMSYVTLRQNAKMLSLK